MASVARDRSITSSPKVTSLPLLGIFDIDKSHCDVVLIKDEINWSLIQPSGKDVRQGIHQKSLNLREVFAVRIKRFQRDGKRGGYPLGVTLYTRRAKRGSCALRQSILTLHTTNEDTCQRWAKAVTNIIDGYKERPKRLRVFIDTQCENGDALQVFHQKVQDLFQLARVSIDVIESSEPGHARQVAQTLTYEGLDGVVCVGDDKIATEISNGLLLRAQSDAHLSIKANHTPLAQCCMPLGIIPVGPFNLVAHSSQGTNDPMTSTLHIIYGNLRPIDVCTIFQNEKLLRFGFSAMYGFGGDCLRRAEKKKMLGKHRAEYAVARSIMKLRPYSCEVSFLPCCDVDGCIEDRTPCQTGCQRCQSDWCLSSLPNRWPSKSSPAVKESSLLRLRVPHINIDGDSSGDNSSVSSYSMSEGRRTPVLDFSSDQSSENSVHVDNRRSPNGWIENTENSSPPGTMVAMQGGEMHAGIISSHFESLQDRIRGIAVLPVDSDVDGGTDWRTIDGSFFNVSVMTLPNRCSLCPGGMSPQTHLGDGSADLILARATTKSDFVHHLRRHASEKDQFDLPFVCVRRVKAVRILPQGANGNTIPSTKSNAPFIRNSKADLLGSESSLDEEETTSPGDLSTWNLDMELVPAVPLEIRIHKQLLTVFGAGVSYSDKSAASCGCL